MTSYHKDTKTNQSRVLYTKILAIPKSLHKPVLIQKSLNLAPFTELTQHTEAAVV